MDFCALHRAQARAAIAFRFILRSSNVPVSLMPHVALSQSSTTTANRHRQLSQESPYQVPGADLGDVILEGYPGDGVNSGVPLEAIAEIGGIRAFDYAYR